MQVSIRHSPGVDALYAPRRHVLDTLLVDAAAAAGVDVVHGVTATALLHHQRRVCGVVAHGAGGTELRWRGDVVVGADGVRSMVARSTAAAVERRAGVSGSVLYRYFDDLPGRRLRVGLRRRGGRGDDPDERRADVRLRGGTSPERLRSPAPSWAPRPP